MIPLVLLMIYGVFSAPLLGQVEVAQAGTLTSETTLADAINSSVLNWTANANTAKFAMVFKTLPLSYYDTLIQQYASSNDWIDVFQVKRFSEIDGYDSPVIEQAVQQALANMPMLENLPLTWEVNGNPYYMVYYRFLLNAYRYAEQYGLTQKWNATAAYQELLAAYLAAGQPSLGYNPVNLTTFPWGPRYYDESAETLDSFVKLGGNDAGIWDYIQKNYWTGSIYGYNGPNQYECEVGFFAMVIGNYYAIMDGNLSNFDRVYLDLYDKLLAQGWSSLGWGVPGVLRHAESNSQLRLENTLGAIQALQAYVGTSTWEPAFVDLLIGSNPAWRALLNSPLYSAGRFKDTSDGSFSDGASAEGMMTLFLEGIIPETGNLAIPLNDERYQDTCDLSPATLFSFDYANKTIRIPVNPGELKFQFGTGIVPFMFPSAGVYEVHFDSSWNSIISVNRLGALDSQFLYLANTTASSPSPVPPVAVFSWSASELVIGWPIVFDASSSWPGWRWNGTTWTTMPIVQYSWDFGDGDATVGNLKIMTHTYFTAGTFEVRLSVTDSEGLNDSLTETITIYGNVTHDLTVTGIRSSRVVIYQGQSCSINVTLDNNGDISEDANVTLYYSLVTGEIVGTQNVTVPLGQNSTLLFVWNPTSRTICYTNYTLTAVVASFENDTPSLTVTPGGNVTVRIVGDINGDAIVNMRDVAIAARAFGSFPGDPTWNADADILGLGKIDMRDIAYIAKNFGKHYS